jgi:hypothetical protein
MLKPSQFLAIFLAASWTEVVSPSVARTAFIPAIEATIDTKAGPHPISIAILSTNTSVVLLDPSRSTFASSASAVAIDSINDARTIEEL